MPSRGYTPYHKYAFSADSPDEMIVAFEASVASIKNIYFGIVFPNDMTISTFVDGAITVPVIGCIPFDI